MLLWSSTIANRVGMGAYVVVKLRIMPNDRGF